MYKTYQKSNSTAIVLLLILSVIILFISKVVLYESCFLFDSNDDSNHTFVNLFESFRHLKSLQLPFINIFNNFGTPLLGDALTYPFSIASLTYLLFDPQLAMTINRIASATLILLLSFKFFSKYFSNTTSFILSLVLLFTPGILWNLAHHHYQLAIPFFLLIIYFISSNNKSNNYNSILLFLIFIFYLLSVSIQLVVFSLPFIFLYNFIENRKRLKSTIFIFISASILTLPHHILFFEYISQSVRLGFTPYVGIITSIRDLILSLFVPLSEWSTFGVNGHFTINTYMSSAFIVLSTIGLYSAIKYKYKFLKLFLFLGLIPFISAYLIQFRLYDLSIFKSIDSLRLIWFASPFLMLPLGYFLDNLDKMHKNQNIRWFSFFLGFTMLIIYFLPHGVDEFNDVGSIHFLVFFLLVIFLLRFSYNGNSFYFIIILIPKFILLLALIPIIYSILGFSYKSCSAPNHYFNKQEKIKIFPENIADDLKPFSRATFIEQPGSGNDLKLVYSNVLGSASRSIISSKKLQRILKEQNIIQLSDNYFFKPPWNFEVLNKLNIRYIISSSEDDKLNYEWNFLKKEDKYYIYENPVKPSIASYEKDNFKSFINKINLIPNGIQLNVKGIDLSNHKIKISLFNHKYWNAYFDGKKNKIYSDDLGMMVIDPNGETFDILTIKYGDSLIKYFLISIIFGLLFFASTRKFYEKKL